MALWKDGNNKVHDDDNGRALSLSIWPKNAVPITQIEADILLKPQLTQAEQFYAIEHRIEQHMDSVAQSDKWDNRWTCSARAGYINPWQTRAIAFGQWMDACWLYTIQEQQKVIAGTRTMPTPDQAVIELPTMIWPV